MSSASEDYPPRFRATLANFRSYCQKNTRSPARLSAQNYVSTATTKYRSIRQIKIKEYNQLLPHKSISKKKTQHSPSKLQDNYIPLKNSQLIELIKLKLRQSCYKNQKLRTEPQPKQQIFNYRYKKSSDLTNYLLQSLKFGKNGKKKKINLQVTHTKYDLQPRREIEKQKEIVIAIKQRPNSAVTYKTNNRIHHDDHKIDYKTNSTEPKQPIKKNSEIDLRLNQCQKTKQFTGWEIPTFQQPFYQNVTTPQAKTEAKKKKKQKKKN